MNTIFYSKFDKKYIFYEIRNNPSKQDNLLLLHFVANELTKERFVFTSSREEYNEEE